MTAFDRTTPPLTGGTETDSGAHPGPRAHTNPIPPNTEAELTIAEAADQILANAPALTPEQRAHLAGLFSTT